MKRIVIVVFCLLVVVGCSKERKEQTVILDQCLRQELFERCMSSLPAGPNETVYNDWAEVVSECTSVAQYHSYRVRKHVKEECRAD